MNFITDQSLRFIADIRQSRSLEDLASLMSETLARFQIEHFAFMELGRNSDFGDGLLTNFPEEWGKRYIDKRYEYNDPVTIKILRTKTPFLWQTLEPEGYLDSKGRHIFFEGGEFGLTDGCTFPIFGVNGAAAALTFAAGRLEADPRLFPALHLISLYFHGKYKELCGRNGSTPADLSPRERECLTWAGAGKTEFEIGEILSIGAATVHTHIDHAKRKLGVNTTIQAVVEAMRHYLIRV